jgi:hypothetical protein
MGPAFQLENFLYDEFENILYIVVAYLLASFLLDE